MTEDLHDDIDDLFRSGLEGKEDTPSQGVWSAIEKALPPTATPLPPSTATPSATGGWKAPVIFKGLIGAAVVVIIGTAAYLIISNKNETSSPANDQTITENTHIEAPVNTEEAVKTRKLRATKQDGSDETKAIHAEDESPSTLMTEADKEILPFVSPDNKTTSLSPEPKRATENPTVKSESNPESGVSGSTNKKTSISPIVHTASTVKAAKTKNTRRGADLLPSTTSSEKVLQASKLPADNSAVKTGPSGVKAIHTNASIDRKKIEHKSLITTQTIIPYSAIPSIGRTPSTESVGSTVRSGSASLKRNDWKSRIYLAPVIAVNITNMEIEENERYGPRIGREHIEFKETEQTKTTISPGIMAGYAIHPSMSVQTGISEFRNNISVSPKQIKAVRDRDGKIRYRMDCSSGSYFMDPKDGRNPSVGDSLRIASSEIRMRYITIPLSVRVDFGNDRVKVFATAGTDINVLSGKQISTIFSTAASEKVNFVRTEGTRKQYMNGNIGAGVEIRAGKRMGIMFMPQYRFPMGNINEEGPVLTYTKTFSLSSGVRIGF